MNSLELWRSKVKGSFWVGLFKGALSFESLAAVISTSRSSSCR
jgi:hypothetical protein